jgi:hypothetical protein
MSSSGPLFRNRYRIPSARLAGWDYRQSGMYFVTVCVNADSTPIDRLRNIGHGPGRQHDTTHGTKADRQRDTGP